MTNKFVANPIIVCNIFFVKYESGHSLLGTGEALLPAELAHGFRKFALWHFVAVCETL